MDKMDKIIKGYDDLISEIDLILKTFIFILILMVVCPTLIILYLEFK